MEKDDQLPAATMDPSGGVPLTNDGILKRLAANPRDTVALVALYESHEKQIRQAATRWFGRNPEFRNRAINSLLVSIAGHAATFDPQSMEPAAWLTRLLHVEAKRLREVWDATGARDLSGQGAA